MREEGGAHKLGEENREVALYYQRRETGGERTPVGDEGVSRER